MIRSCSAWMVATMSERRLAGQAGSGRILPGTVEVKHLVLDGKHRSAAGPDVPAAANPLGAGGGRGVERARRRRPPVDEQRLVLALLVEQPEPPDIAPPILVFVVVPVAVVSVAVGVAVQVEPPEAQALLDAVQGGELR
jgi:hypothetical protein